MSDERLREAAAAVMGHVYGEHIVHPEWTPECVACDLRAALAATPETPTLDAPIQEDDYDGPYNTAGGHEHWSEA